MTQKTEPLIIIKTIKIKKPDIYTGERKQLYKFLIIYNLYISFNHNIFQDKKDKILFVIEHLRNKTLDWIISRLEDYLENDERNRDKKTKMFFRSYKFFKEKLQTTFGDIDRQKTTI